MGQSQAWRRPPRGVETARRLLTWFTVLLAAGALLVLGVQVASGVEGASEALLVLLVLMGALLLAGAQRDRHLEVGADRTVAAGTAAAIDALDRVEYRRLELGTPWPQLVVGPTGVSIVDVCPNAGPLHLAASAGRSPSRGRVCERCAAACAAADRARQLLAGVEDGRSVPVRVLAVAPTGTVGGDPSAGDLVDAVPADRLSDALARGPVLPMPLVDRAFARLASMAGALVDG